MKNISFFLFRILFYSLYTEIVVEHTHIAGN